MKSKFLLILFLYIFKCWCHENKTILYCVAPNESRGLVLVDSVRGKDTHLGGYRNSKFFDNSTESINFINNSIAWTHVVSTQAKNHLDQPILDQRWEDFITSQEHFSIMRNIFLKPKDYENYSIFFSVRIFQTEKNTDPMLEDYKWNLLVLKNSSLYICENNTNENCTVEINNVAEFYTSTLSAKSIWKLHNTSYLYTEQPTISNTRNSNEQQNKSVNIENEANGNENNSSKQQYPDDKTVIYENSENCFFVKYGCLRMFLAACENCKAILEFTPSNDTFKTKLEEINGTGAWNTETISLDNYTNCFALSVKINILDLNESYQNVFWAIGDIGYISTDLKCKNNQRYISVNLTDEIFANTTICEDSFSNEIEFMQYLPKMEMIDAVANSTVEENPVNNSTKNNSPDQNTNSSSFNPWYLLILVPAILLIVIFGTVCYIRKKEIKYSTVLYEENVELTESEFKEWKGIKSNDFSSYIQTIFDPNKKYDYLEKQFSNLPSGYLKSVEVGKSKENFTKNRFVKIYPYDENRVVLQKDLRERDYVEDYINASYVAGHNNPKEYIVTQNPLENTVVDFYRMIWQENVEYVVMLSSGDEKICKYWPDLKQVMTFGNMDVRVVEVIPYEFYNHRLLLVQRYGETRTINQLHFHSWLPEMLSSHMFVDFVNHLLKIPHSLAPVVFHCLAGVGRSATILLCDIAIRTAALTNTYNLYDITKQMRECRPDMVQNLTQYKMAHLIIFEVLNCKDTKVRIDSDFENNIARKLEGNTVKKIWSNHLESTEWLYEAITPYQTCTDFLKRNRYQDSSLLPVKHSRVVLEYKQPDYIHAMYVLDYHQMKNIIVAQQPLRFKNSLSNFWIMVLQNHIQLIINLNEPDTTYGNPFYFFPTSTNQTITVENDFKVEFINQEDHLNYEMLNLKLNAKVKKQITIVNVKNWPAIKKVPGSTDVMVALWEVANRHRNGNVPVLICCDDGITSSSLLACFFYMTDQMLKEKICNVVAAVRAVRRTHMNFINFDQFVFLHHCALAFCKNCYKR